MILDPAELKQRYALRLAGVQDKKVYIGPEIVTLQINNTCNLTCKYCWTHAPGNPAHFDKPNQFSFEKFQGVVRDSVDLKVDQIHITGSGEPTMHARFREMMRYLEHKPVYVKLLTNATFPTEYCDDVIKGDHVIIDLSAVNREQYKQLQGKDLFDRVLANIKRLVFLRDTIKSKFFIEVVYIVNRDNVHQADEMKALMSQLKVDLLYFERMNVHAYNRDIAVPENRVAEVAGEDRITPPECLHGWFFVILKPGDLASMCCRIHQMHLGDLSKLSFKQLWLSSHMMNVRLLGKYGEVQKKYKACETCPYYEKNIKRMTDARQLGKNEQTLTQ
ncbi:MAG: radical SAM protein [Candidatus Omnitrophica bacterium]|nr:radical SAM protein [Candidatus Omnitrophota bacterium]